MNLSFETPRGGRVHPAALAGGSGAGPRAAHSGEYLSFRLGAGEYGIDILRVQEIRSYEVPTRIASAPPFVEGVLNLRGVIVPIVDLRLKLGLLNAYGRADCDGSTALIVLEVRGRVVGAVVDAVSDVLALGREHLRPAPEGSNIDPVFITGLGAVAQDGTERRLILIDIEALMSSEDIGLINRGPSAPLAPLVSNAAVVPTAIRESF